MLSLFGFGDDGWSSMLLAATLTTLLLTVSALLIGAVFGGLVASAKLSSSRMLRGVAEGYSVIFRGIPELLIIYLFYFGSSGVLTEIGKWFGADGFIQLPPFFVGALVVGLISGSYQAEVYRAALLAIPRGQIEAGMAVGMPKGLILRHITIPQLFRLALPGLSNVWQMSLKDSALISVTGIVEIMRASQMAAGSTRQYFTFFVAGAVLYLVLTSFSNVLFNRAEERMNRSLARQPGSSK